MFDINLKTRIIKMLNISITSSDVINILIFMSGASVSYIFFFIKVWVLAQISIFHLLTFITLIISVSVGSWKLGYFDKIPWIKSKKDMLISGYNMANVFNNVYNKNPISTGTIGSGESGPSFSINDTKKSASIVYNRIGKNYIINFPYDRTSVGKLSKYKFYLERKDEETGKIEYIDITQQPGVTYLCTASQLGGYKIIIKDKLTGEITHKFDEHDIPHITVSGITEISNKDKSE